MQELFELLNRCKNSVSITVNDHRDYYESVADHLSDKQIVEEIPTEVMEGMIKRDTIVRIQAYPDTAIGFYLIYHYDLSTAIRLCLEAVKEKK